MVAIVSPITAAASWTYCVSCGIKLTPVAVADVAIPINGILLSAFVIMLLARERRQY